MSEARREGLPPPIPAEGRPSAKAQAREMHTSVYMFRLGPEGSGKRRVLSKGMHFRRFP